MYTIIVNARYHAGIIIKILVLDRSSASPAAGSKKKRTRIGTPSYHMLKLQLVIIMNILSEWQKAM
jgi:hypothetical protein